MITVKVIPYRSFKERIKLVSELLKQKNTIVEVYRDYIYVEVQKGEFDASRL